MALGAYCHTRLSAFSEKTARTNVLAVRSDGGAAALAAEDAPGEAKLALALGVEGLVVVLGETDLVSVPEVLGNDPQFRVLNDDAFRRLMKVLRRRLPLCRLRTRLAVPEAGDVVRGERPCSLAALQARRLPAPTSAPKLIFRRRRRMLTRRTICGSMLAGLLAGCEPLGSESADKPVLKIRAADETVRRVISADGVSISFEVKGRRETALVFIHGWSCDSEYWKAQLAFFSDAYTTVAVDLAGHGLSGADRRNWSMAAYGKDVAAVIRALPNQRVILIGHSMGGYVALEAAHLQPERVIGVVGVDSLQDLDGRQTDTQGAAALLTALRQQPREATRAFVLETFFTEQSDAGFDHRAVSLVSQGYD